MTSVREKIVERFQNDLIGPRTVDEMLQSRPSDIYMTGILWPKRVQFSASEDEDGPSGDTEDDDLSSAIYARDQQKPSSMGITFTVPIDSEDSILIELNFGVYEKVSPSQDGLEEWKRKVVFVSKTVSVANDMNQFIHLNEIDCEPSIAIHVRSLRHAELRAVTVTLINNSDGEGQERREIDSITLFQTEIRVFRGSGRAFTGIPDLRAPQDEDEESNRLLYLNEVTYAFGHQCSAAWNVEEMDCRSVYTTWLPEARVPSYRQDGHAVFAEIVKSEKLNVRKLSQANPDDVISILKELIQAYRRWILEKEDSINKLSPELRRVAAKHITKCKEVATRMENGVEFLATNEKAMSSFQLANLAMAVQHEWKGNKTTPLQWRPFQLGFILMCFESVCNRDSHEREILDLLWFPTGGGKTEAYLALISAGAIYRRLNSFSEDEKSGNFAIMRYTLRLLTLQQFERAGGLILALELIRRGAFGHRGLVHLLGERPFSVGLWVGGDATPNRYGDAEISNGRREGVSAEQLSRCYVCNSLLQWNYNKAKLSVRPYCVNSECQLGPSFGIWPILTVDDDIYMERPTLVIGTVDKFAQLPINLNMGSLFGFRTMSATDLIVQDELHLISGPLGTIVGAYETAFDWLLRKNGKRCKVIGSTATIRRAAQQVNALFDRESCQFPPAGLSHDDSGFAVVDSERPGRLYVGVTTVGRSAKFSLQAAAASLLQSSVNKSIGTLLERDGYCTLLMYFNALRELGGALVQVSDDVPDSIELFARARGELPRSLEPPRELTSKVSQRDIGDTLRDLSIPYDQVGSVDVALATNMVSVGVDVSRLGLMLINGQPKTRSEYIQSTSRVGRSAHPGLIICVLNGMKARDRSHYETFLSWHRTLYRDVEATSVTPFASRARDRVLKALLVSMVRHSDPLMSNQTNLSKANRENLFAVTAELERRVRNVEPDTVEDLIGEIDAALDEWWNRETTKYIDYSPKGIRNSLLQTAENYAQKLAAGVWLDSAWPVMNTMRSVEAGCQFRLKERRNWTSGDGDLPPWRRNG